VAVDGAPGTYNLALSHVGTNSAAAPGGCSYGTAMLASNGAVTLTLHLADGTSPPLSLTTAEAADGSFPFFAPLYGGRGVILGWLNFTNDTVTPADLEGANLAWAKLPVPDKFYTNGFSTVTTPFAGMALGSYYAAPKSGTNIFATAINDAGTDEIPLLLTDGPDGNVSINAAVVYDPQGNTLATQTPNPEDLSLTLVESTGFLGGKFEPYAGVKPIPFNGILLPGNGAGYGYFLGTNQDTGGFFLGAQSQTVVIGDSFSLEQVRIRIHPGGK
jgi:hypothetical protein